MTRLFAIAATALLVLAASAPIAAAKKVKKIADVTTAVNQAVPEEVNNQDGILTSTAEVGEWFKGRKIRDVNVSMFASGDWVGDIQAKLTAPNGATTILVFGGITIGSSWGDNSVPLTLDDESPLLISPVPADFSPTFLFEPYAGTAQPTGKPLSVMDNGRARGTWTLTLRDDDDANGQTTLGSWRLEVLTGKRFAVKGSPDRD